MKLVIDSKGDFNNARAWISRVVNRSPVDTLRHIANDGEKSLAANTPRGATGETAAGWISEITSSFGQSEVAWMNNAHPGESVNIARIIDQGHGTGTGGYVPPIPYIHKSMEAVWKLTDDRIVKELIK